MVFFMCLLALSILVFACGWFLSYMGWLGAKVGQPDNTETPEPVEDTYEIDLNVKKILITKDEVKDAQKKGFTVLKNGVKIK